MAGERYRFRRAQRKAGETGRDRYPRSVLEDACVPVYLYTDCLHNHKFTVRGHYLRPHRAGLLGGSRAYPIRLSEGGRHRGISAPFPIRHAFRAVDGIPDVSTELEMGVQKTELGQHRVGHLRSELHRAAHHRLYPDNCCRIRRICQRRPSDDAADGYRSWSGGSCRSCHDNESACPGKEKVAGAS